MQKDILSNTASYSDVLANYSDENLTFRSLESQEVNQKYMNLIAQLTNTPSVNQELQNQLANQLKASSLYHIIIVTDRQNNSIVGNGTLYCVPKIYNNKKRKGYVEDIVVDKNYREKGIGTKIMNILFDIGKRLNCNKVRLDCSEKMFGFYKSMGYERSGVQFSRFPKETDVIENLQEKIDLLKSKKIFLRKLTKNDLNEKSDFKNFIKQVVDQGVCEETNLDFFSDEVFEKSNLLEIYLLKDHEKNIVGCGTISIEYKFFNELCKIGHIDDIFFTKNYENLFGTFLEYLFLKCVCEHNAWRVILGANDDQETIEKYALSGFKDEGIDMSKYV